MKNLLTKKGSELTKKEINEINFAKAREFKLSKMSDFQVKNSLFFLLKDKNENLLAMGQLISISLIRFMHETFSVLGIGGIVSNIKGKCYGKMIMTAIKNYLIKNQKIGVGFCGKHNK